MQFNILPTTTPFKPPFTLSNFSIPSTSSPKSVSRTEISSGVSSSLINCCNHLLEIFNYLNFNDTNIVIYKPNFNL